MKEFAITMFAINTATIYSLLAHLFINYVPQKELLNYLIIDKDMLVLFCIIILVVINSFLFIQFIYTRGIK